MNIGENQYRDAGVWELRESFVSDCSYHQVNGGGDSNPIRRYTYEEGYA